MRLRWWLLAGLALVLPRGAEAAPRVGSIVFSGAASFDRSTLLGVLSTREASFLGPGFYDPAVFARDLDRLAAFYLSQGFLEIRVLALPPAHCPDSSSVDLTIEISEGPQWRVSGVVLSGAQAVPADSLLRGLDLRRGEPYRPRMLPADQRRILDVYASAGYLDAELSQEILADPDGNTIEILYRVVEGPVASVSSITISGLDKTRASTVLRELEFGPGDRIDPYRWGRSQSNLYNTGLFDWVWIEPSTADRGKPQKEVLVIVGEKPRWEISAGVGYGRFDQERLVAGLRQVNLFGRAVRAGLEGKVSRKTRRAEFQVSEPWFLGRRIIANGTAGYRWRDEPEFLAESVEGAAVFSRALRTRVFVDGGYHWRRTTLLRDSRAARLEDRRNRTSVLAAAVSWKMQDDLFNTTRGFFLRVEGEYAGTFLGGTSSFLRAQVYSRHFTPLPGGWVLAASAHVGAMTPRRAGGRIPINERFFLGGDQSVRGYPRHSIGPVDERGRVLGARRIVELGQELRIPLGRRLVAVLFSDQGALFGADPDDWAVGAGGGLRIVTPFGVLRAEAARGLTERWGTGTEYYLSVGQAF